MEKEMEAKEYLLQAVAQAQKTMRSNKGGPFGAAIVDTEGKVYVASNTVLEDKDPTAHAEVNVIRKTCKEKGTFDLSGCILYTTCYPCPMCLAACIWANIRKIYYGSTAKDAEEVGFRDDYIYKFIGGSCSDTKVMELVQSNRETTQPLFEEYKRDKKVLY